MSFVFLKAAWNNLIMVNYVADPQLLTSYLPAYTELDVFQGKTYVSLVGFYFNNTRILGCKVPYHINFEEVNLRFYVRYNHLGQWRRGVVFIKEIVPRHAITYIANTIYREKYATMPMNHSLEEKDDELYVEYSWKHRNRWNSMGVTAGNHTLPMAAESEEDFIAQHYYGYSKYKEKVTYEYEVRHPGWEVYPVKSYSVNCDFTALYGENFSFLQTALPSSVFLAKGSPVTILQKRSIRSASLL